MNRHLPVLVAFLLISASCSHTYRVSRYDLTKVNETIPAVDEDGRETWISRERVKNPRESEHPGYVDVDVSDTRRTLLTTGGAIAAYGLIVFVNGLVMMKTPERPGDDTRDTALNGLFATSMGGVIALTGGSLTLAGFLTDPPERPAPADVALPPAR